MPLSSRCTIPGRSGAQTPAATSSARSGNRASSPPTRVPLVVARPRVHHEPGRLVHHRHRVVGVHDLEAHVRVRRHTGVSQPRAARTVSVAPSRSGVRPTDAPARRRPAPGRLRSARRPRARETSATMATPRSTRTPASSAGTSVVRSALRPSVTPGRSRSITVPRPRAACDSGLSAPARPPKSRRDDDDDHAHRHARIGQVEGRPVVERDEVGHLPPVPADDPLAQVPHGTAEDQPAPTASGTVRTCATTNGRAPRHRCTSSTVTATARPLKRLNAKPEL